jgi:hypothetical protein
MAVAIGVINDRLFLDALLGRPKIKVNDSVAAGRGGQCRDFKGIQRLARVAVGHLGQMPQGRFVRLNSEVAQTALRIRQGAPQQFQRILLGQRLQLEDLRARHQRRIDEEKRIMRRRADQPHHAALDIGQQDILLRLVKAVNLVNEQNGGLPGVFQAIGRRRQHPAHIGHIGLDTAEAVKLAARLPRNDLSQRSFARARRPVKNDRLDAISLDGAAQQLSRGQDMFLSGKFIERARPHAGGQWLRSEGFRRFLCQPGCGRFRRGGKQIIARHTRTLAENHRKTKPEAPF